MKKFSRNLSAKCTGASIFQGPIMDNIKTVNIFRPLKFLFYSKKFKLGVFCEVGRNMQV